MASFFTDDKQHVIVDETIYDLDTFIMFFGKDALPRENKGEQRFFNEYYSVFLELLNAIGRYLHSWKLLRNAEEDNNPSVNEVRNKYYENNDNLRKKVAERKNLCWKKVNYLAILNEKLGFEAWNTEEKRNLLNFLSEKKRRTYIRRKVKGFLDKEEQYSVAEICQICLSAQDPR